MVGGRGNSVIPFEAEMNLDIRVPIQYTTTQVYDKMMKIIAAYQNSNPKIGIKTQVLDTVEPFEAKKATPIVNVLASSVRKVINKPATLLRKTGTGDMNILGNAMNLPIVTYGPGDGTPRPHPRRTHRSRRIPPSHRRLQRLPAKTFRYLQQQKRRWPSNRAITIGYPFSWVIRLSYRYGCIPLSGDKQQVYASLYSVARTLSPGQASTRFHHRCIRIATSSLS